MCAPITVTTGVVTGGAASSGCTGICQVMPQILASMGIFGLLIWNFRRPIGERLGFSKTSA